MLLRPELKSVIGQGLDACFFEMLVYDFNNNRKNHIKALYRFYLVVLCLQTNLQYNKLLSPEYLNTDLFSYAEPFLIQSDLSP